MREALPLTSPRMRGEVGEQRSARPGEGALPRYVPRKRPSPDFSLRSEVDLSRQRGEDS